MTDYKTEVELDQEWRFKELSFISNQANSLSGDDLNYIHRIGIIIMYSHYEGFMYHIFNVYAKHLNSQKLKAYQVKLPLASAATAKIFRDLRNTQKSIPKEISATLSSEIHQAYRDAQFLVELRSHLDKVIEIPDEAISADSNLKMSILKPILFRLGFPLNYLDKISKDVTKLVTYRNDIAHGVRTKAISKQEFDKLYQTTLHLMDDVKEIIYKFIENEEYLSNELDILNQLKNDYY